MSNFWNLWIIGLTTLTIIGVTWILFANRTVEKDETERTTGHVYDGIEEYDNPLPSWWFNLFLASIVFSIGYLVLYPGMGSYKGFLNWTATSQWQKSVDDAEKSFNENALQYTSLPAAQLVNYPNAINMGKRIFKSYCTTCHGNNAKGAYAFPNLTDNDWLYGSTEEQITQTIINGRQGMMPAWEAILGNDLDKMADYVSHLHEGNSKNTNPEKHPMHEKFGQMCSACHGADAHGNQLFGAPNLTDAIWLYGGSIADIKLSLQKGRNGHMPAHKDILSPERIHLVVGYILSINEQNAK